MSNCFIIFTLVTRILFAPYAVIPGAIIAYGQSVQVQLETKDGEILDIRGHKI